MLFLMILGAASVSAQVRIGGNGTPNPAAVLDLNATDAATGTKGLALPRVSLTNATIPLTGTPVVYGMLVYNTNATMTGGSGVGIYYWDTTNKWVKMINSDFTVPLNKIDTTGIGIGRFVMRTSTGFGAVNYNSGIYTATDTLITLQLGTVTWTKVLDTSLSVTFQTNASTLIPVKLLSPTAICNNGNNVFLIQSYYNELRVWSTNGILCFFPNKNC